MERKGVTWLNEPHVKDLVNLAVVGGDVEDTLWRVLDAGDVDRYQILRDLLPLDRAGTTRTHMEHLCP